MTSLSPRAVPRVRTPAHRGRRRAWRSQLCSPQARRRAHPPFPAARARARPTHRRRPWRSAARPPARRGDNRAPLGRPGARRRARQRVPRRPLFAAPGWPPAQPAWPSGLGLGFESSTQQVRNFQCSLGFRGNPQALHIEYRETNAHLVGQLRVLGGGALGGQLCCQGCRSGCLLR